MKPLNKEDLFLKELSELLKKHNANLCIEANVIGYSGAEAELSFDIIDHSFSNYIADTTISKDLDYKDIENLIGK